jgi:hypothetical protein
MVAVAVAVTAIVLGSGVSAAVTGGRSVNPLDGIQQVVAQLTGGRTEEQAAALDEANRHLAAAKAAVERDDKQAANAELQKITNPLLLRLTDEDRARVKAQLSQLREQVPN